MSQNSDSETCRLDDNYEYTRLQDTSYELANSNEGKTKFQKHFFFHQNSLFDLVPNENARPTENRRLLYLDS